MIRLRCSFPPLRKNKRDRKRNFHPAAGGGTDGGRHEGFPIISSDHLSPSPFVAELSLSIIRFPFRFSFSLLLRSVGGGIICQVVISEHFYVLLSGAASVRPCCCLGRVGPRIGVNLTGGLPERTAHCTISSHSVELCCRRTRCSGNMLPHRFYTAIFLLMAPFEPCNDVNLPPAAAAARIANSAAAAEVKSAFWPLAAVRCIGSGMLAR